MIDDYLKKLETIISPQTYDMNNYKEKIIQSPLLVPDKQFLQNLDGTEVVAINLQPDVKELNQNLDGEFETKNINTDLQTEKNLSQNRLTERLSDVGRDRNLSLKPNISQLNRTEEIDSKTRERIHQLNVKNMAYRQQIDALGRKVEELNKELENKNKKIDQYEIQIENNSKYLLKLESYMVEAGKNKGRERFVLNMLGVHSDFNMSKSSINTSNLNSTIASALNADKASFSVDKGDMKSIVIALVNENQKLKNFQNQVLKISKNYDDINESMAESIKKVQALLEEVKSKLSSNKTDQIKNQVEEIYENFNTIVVNVDSVLQAKQDEYNFLLDSKEKEIKFLRDEIILVNHEFENFKKDRFKDQKINIEIESENIRLKKEVDNLNSVIHDNFTKLKLLDSQNVSSKIEVKYIIYRKESSHVKSQRRI